MDGLADGKSILIHLHICLSLYSYPLSHLLFYALISTDVLLIFIKIAQSFQKIYIFLHIPYSGYITLTPPFKMLLVRTNLPVPSPDPKSSSDHIPPAFAYPIVNLNLA